MLFGRTPVGCVWQCWASQGALVCDLSLKLDQWQTENNPGFSLPIHPVRQSKPPEKDKKEVESGKLIERALARRDPKPIL